MWTPNICMFLRNKPQSITILLTVNTCLYLLCYYMIKRPPKTTTDLIVVRFPETAHNYQRPGGGSQACGTLLKSKWYSSYLRTRSKNRKCKIKIKFHLPDPVFTQNYGAWRSSSKIFTCFTISEYCKKVSIYIANTWNYWWLLLEALSVDSTAKTPYRT